MTPGSDTPAIEHTPGFVAVLDLGTNTFRLLIASLDEHQQLVRHRVERQIVRMGSGVVADGAIAGDAVARGVRALDAFAAIIRECPVTRVTAVATGVFRDAANATQTVARLSAPLCSSIQVLSGVQEGAYTLAGVRAGAGCRGEVPALVLDVGGGSTECARLTPDGTVSIQSIPVGVLYLREALGAASPMTGLELAALRERAASALDGIDLPTGSTSTPCCIGTGGSITTLAWITLGLRRYDPVRIHGTLLTAPVVEGLLSEVLRLPCEALIRRYGLERERADLVVFGGILTAEILRRLPGGYLRVSDTGLLEGVAQEALTVGGARC